MKTTLISRRGRVLSFPELDVTNLYLVLADRNTYLCDTFLGPEPMKLVKELLHNEGRSQPIVIFNSHKDWDHIWGNCAFPTATIIATEQCAANMRQSFEQEWAQFGGVAQGIVTPAYPNLLFSGRLLFPEDNILFFSSPGHTNGSGSAFDMQDGVLFVGDNVESPLPFIYSSDLASYVRTLENYLAMDPAGIITGHGAVSDITLDLLRANLDYVLALAADESPDQSSWGNAAKRIHRTNQRMLAGNS